MEIHLTYPKEGLSQAPCDLNIHCFVVATVFWNTNICYSVNSVCFFLLKACLFYPEITLGLIKSPTPFSPPCLHHVRHLWLQQCYFSFPEVKWNLAYQKVTVSLFLFCCFSQLSESLWSCSSLYLIFFLCLSILKSTLIYKEI